MTRQVATSLVLNMLAVGGLSMLGFGLWTWSQPAFWIVGGLVVFAGSLYFCIRLKE